MMNFSDGLLACLLSLPVLATVLPLLPVTHWTVRIFDFPRLQIAVLSALCLSAGVWFQQSGNLWLRLLEGANALCMCYQLWEISAYTRLSRPQVGRYRGAADDNSISLLTSNVLTPNRRYERLLALVQQWQPDIVLTLESDAWWQERLAVLEQDYAYTVKIPLDNLYGMHLYSRLPLRDAEVRHWVQEDVPSIRTDVQLRSGHWVRLYCLHPMPPAPQESTTSTHRDAELLLVGQEIACSNMPVMVFGDLNDVAWSSTSRLFQKTSGLLDPRIGRGLFSTFHVHWPLMRWPLDHIFHSSDFLMREIRVLPNIGSDHFPVYGSFQYHPAAESVQEAPQAEPEDHREVQQKIEAAEPEQKVVREKY